LAFFDYREGRLHVESVPVDKIAEQMQTPVNCYSASALQHNFQSYTDQFKPENSLICYAVKTNSNQAIIRALGKMGAGADVVSEGELRNRGHSISVLDIGGGLGIDYADENQTPPSITDYAALANGILGHLGCQILVEPGRSLVGNVGLLISRVIYIKDGERDRFLIIDAGMNDLLRPSMYDAFHEIVPCRHSNGEAQQYQVVGPICETGDTFAQNRSLPPMLAGDLVAIKNAGAYGAVMSSSYNTRPQVPEVLVQGNEITVIRQRSTYNELIGLDSPDGFAPASG
jgi:diaminopimelate decarboxylase